MTTTDITIGTPITCNADLLEFYLTTANFNFNPAYYMPLQEFKMNFEDFCREMSYYPRIQWTEDFYANVFSRLRLTLQSVELEWPPKSGETQATMYLIGVTDFSFLNFIVER